MSLAALAGKLSWPAVRQAGRIHILVNLRGRQRRQHLPGVSEADCESA
jgi:hypothetical protein